MKDQSRNFGSLRVDTHFAVFHIVAQHRCAKDYAPLHLTGLSPFNTGRSLTAFLLRNAAHDGQAQLCVRFQGVDPVIHEQDPYAQGLQFPGKGDRIQNISGEAAYLLGDNEFEFTHVGIVDHAIEVGTLLGGCAGDAFVGVDLIKLPIRLSVYVLFEIPLLCCKRICLVVLVRGDAAIACYWNHSFLTSSLIFAQHS